MHSDDDHWIWTLLEFMESPMFPPFFWLLTLAGIGIGYLIGA